MTPAPTPGRRWFVPPPDPGGPVVFCFPYAGVGASSYRQWPRRIGGFQVCAVQPPGRENRTREPAHRSHAAFAADLVDALAPYTGHGFAFAGHCGAVPYALETIVELEDRGLPLPSRLVASSWGAPHRGLYGALNFVDLSTVDLVPEVMALFGREGAPMRRDFAEIAARVLRTDLEVQRGYRWDAGRRVPCPVTVVAWTDDDVVPPGRVHPGWSDCADVTEELLAGRHLDFLQCPEVLREAMHRWLAPPSTDGGPTALSPARASG